MKIFWKIFLAGLLVGAGVGLLIATDTPQKIVRVIVEHRESRAADRVKGTSHVIYMTSPVAGPAGCSATSIGPHALLTASHCEKPDDYVVVDGKRIRIVKYLRDGNDHTIFLLSEKDIQFSDTAKVTPRQLHKGEFVFIWGNPGDTGVQFVGDLRIGKYVTQNVFDGIIVDVFDLPAQHGDSGSAIFDSNGNVVDVLSIGGALKIPHYGDVANATGALHLGFKQAELDEAAKF